MKQLSRFSLLLLIPLLLFAGEALAYRVTHNYVRVSAVAGEALAVGDIVAIKAADGKAYKADADDATLRPAVGIVGGARAIGATAEIIVVGRVTGWTGLTPGAYGYLSETAGLVTQTAPAWNQPLGVALSATDYFVTFNNYFDSSGLTAVGTLTQGLVFEGTTADAFETTVTITDPTADRAVTVPDASGTVDLAGAATHDYAGAAVAWSLTAAEAQASFISVSNANGAVDAVLPAATAGKFHAVYNNSGQVLTFKVTGQAGETLATGKYGLYVQNGTDVVEIYEQP